MSEERVQRRLAAIPATEMVDYGRPVEADAAGTCARFNACLHELIELAIAMINRLFRLAPAFER